VRFTRVVRSVVWSTELTIFAIPAIAQDKPNILVIWGDDIGYFNVSAYNRGAMGYNTPNIDSIAADGILFTDGYGQNSCTAGRSAFITGQSPFRTGLLKVGLPGAEEGLSEKDPTIAGLLKPLGYMTGQFGKNHLGDLDEHLPTNHGFDEFFGNLYHLNAEDEPENADYPKDPEFAKNFGPRGVIHSTADGKIEDTGPLNMKRMETIDEEVTELALDFIDRAHAAEKPFFVWYNTTRMHVWTRLKEESKGVTGQGIYADGMVEHDGMVGELLAKLDELGIADDTLVMYSTDNGPHYNTWPDAGTTPFRSEKNSNWEGAYRVPTFVRWPGHWQKGVTLNGIVSHEDWLPTFAAVAGDTDVKERLLKGTRINGRKYRNHLDGYNLLDYLSGKTDQSPRHEFWYVSDDGQVVAARYDDWKITFHENRGQGFGVWREPYVELRAPLITHMRRDPFEKAQHNSNTYDDWWLDRPFILVPIQGLAAEFLLTMKEYPPSQSPGAFNLSKIEEQLRSASGSH